MRELSTLPAPSLGKNVFDRGNGTLIAMLPPPTVSVPCACFTLNHSQDNEIWKVPSTTTNVGNVTQGWGSGSSNITHQWRTAFSSNFTFFLEN